MNTKRYHTMLCCALWLTLCWTPSEANDSMAEVGAGGLTLRRNEGIVMDSEILEISAKRVRVRYVFINQSKQDVTTLVAFPLAEIEDNGGDIGVDLKADNPMHFSARVDGKAVKVRLERKRPRAGMLKLTYYWKQTFPRGRKLYVEHTYRPGFGSFFLGPEEKWARETFCIDRSLQRTIDAASRKRGMLVARHLTYILSTGSHWKGPIRDFHLIIDKGAPRNLISLCIDGIKKTGPTRFEVRRKDFKPRRDLRILFLEKL